MDLLKIVSVPDYAVNYLDYLEKRGRQSSTIQRYLYDLQDFFKWNKKRLGKELEFEEWRQLSMDIYHSYFEFLLQEKGYSDRTLHRIFTVLKRFAVYYNSINKKATIPELSNKLFDNQGKILTDLDFISKDEFSKLESIIQSKEGLTKRQMKSRHMIIDRNLSIIYMMYYEGLTLQEVTSLNMEDFNFVLDIIKVNSLSSNSREIKVDKWRKLNYYNYYKTIPAPVRPKLHSKEPFFCAFHFNLGTYHFVYDEDMNPLYPKRITEIGIQRMLQKELERGGLRKGISSQHLRNTSILNAILRNESKKDIMKKFGFKLELSLKRYYDYAKKGNNI